MTLSSRTAAGRSRSADEDAFLRPPVVHTTGNDSGSSSTASPHAWKRALQEKIWSPDGPKGLAARSILSLLLWHADANGRVWLGIQAIASKTGAGSLRTVRNALDALARDGWLQSSSQTWATLTAEQTAAGRPVPRRGDVGQAPNLYVVLDGQANATRSRPGLVRAAIQPPTPGQNGQGGPRQKCRGEPLADLHHDLDPKGSRSKIVSAERETRVGKGTHIFSKVHDENVQWLEAWNVIVETHADKTKSVYGLPPLRPDIKREQQQALAECLHGAAVDVRAKLHARSGLERSLSDVQRELATRVMNLYFKRDNEHLRRVKHALRDLPREFHARITEAMQMLLRESHDAEKPRQTRRETQFIETNKPTVLPTPAQSEAAQVITAREARRLLETLSGTPSREEVASRPSLEREQPTRLRHETREILHHASQDKPIVQDKPIAETVVTTRQGAPRWGAVAPRHAKVRCVSTPPSDAVDTCGVAKISNVN